MKRIIVMTAGLAVVAFGIFGCLSMGLKSDDPKTRLAAVEEVKEQPDLLEIARSGDYQNDVRLAAMKRLKDQRNLWRLWCENGDNQEVASGALDLLKDESLLVRVALLHSYEESAEEKEARESKETKKGFAMGAAKLAVSAGGAVAASKVRGAGGALAVEPGTKAANAGIDLAFSEPKAPEPKMAIRTNDAVVAVGKLSSLAAISNVAALSTIECVQLPAFRRLLQMTDNTNILKYAAINGEMEENRACRYSGDVEKKNKALAIKNLSSPAILTEIISSRDGASSQYAFARLVQLKAFDAIAEMLCAYPAHRFLPSVRYGEDLSDANAAKLVARFPDERICIKLALGSQSPAIAKVAVGYVKDEAALLSIARKTSNFEIFKLAITRISNEKSYEDMTLAGGKKSEFALGLLKDADYILEVFGKAEKSAVRMALAKKLAVKDITADLCLKEKEDAMRKLLFERAEEDAQVEAFSQAEGDFRRWAAEKIAASRITADMCESEKDLDTRRILRKQASDDVKAELASRRAEKIKKAVAIAEKDGKELLRLVATKKRDQIDCQKITSFFKGRLLVFSDAEMMNNDWAPHGRKGCSLYAGDENQNRLGVTVVFETGAKGVKEKFSMGDRMKIGGLVNDVVLGDVRIDGDVVDAKEELGLEKITHIFDVYDPDDVLLDAMVSDSDQLPTERYAESVGWEMPTEKAADEKKVEKKADEKSAEKKAEAEPGEVKEDKEPGEKKAEAKSADKAGDDAAKAESKPDEKNAEGKPVEQKDDGTAKAEGTEKQKVDDGEKAGTKQDKAKQDKKGGSDGAKASAEKAEVAVKQAVRSQFKSPEEAIAHYNAMLVAMLKKFGAKLYWTLTLFPLIVGALMLFFGQRHFKKLIFLIGAFLIYLPSHYLLPLVMPWFKSAQPLADNPELVAIGMAVIGGLFMVILYPLFVMGVGALPVVIVALACGVDPQNPGLVWSATAGAFALLAFIFRKHIVIPVSAYIGAVMVTIGIVFLQKFNLRPYVELGIVVGLTLWGILVQYAFTARRKPKKAAADPNGGADEPQPPASAAPAAPSAPAARTAPTISAGPKKPVMSRTPTMRTGSRRFAGPMAPKRKPTIGPRPLKPAAPAPVAPAEPTPVASTEPTPVASTEPTPVASTEPVPAAPAEPTSVAPATADVPDLPEVADLPETSTTPES